MAPAATSLINAQTARESFGESTHHPHILIIFSFSAEKAIKDHASMVTTEISQVPFSGVYEVLKMAKWVVDRGTAGAIVSGICFHLGKLVFHLF